MPASPLIRWTVLTAAVLVLLLVPFALFETQINAWTERFLDSGHSRPLIAAVAGLLLAGDVLLPIPSSLVSTAAGYLLGLVPATLVSWIGMSAGCGLGYIAGAWAERGAGRWIVSEEEFTRLAKARERYGDGILILLRAVPVLAEASVIFAGFSRMPAGRFFAITTAANLGISFAYAAVGAFAVDANSFLLAFAGAIVIPGLLMGVARRFRA